MTLTIDLLRIKRSTNWLQFNSLRTDGLGEKFRKYFFSLPKMVESNKKTARVCFLSGNITRVVFLAGKPVSKKTTSVIFPRKTHECHFLFIT
jgi:hypothetical protein